MADVEALKAKGNKAFAAKDYNSAIETFTEAIKLDPSNHVLYSNRSAAYAGKREWSSALEDAESCIKANPKWAKGYARKGAALHGAHRFDEAIAAYEEGIKLEDSPQLQKGLKEVTQARDHDRRSAGENALGNMFSDPGALAKLAANPKTAKYLADPSFMRIFSQVQKNPAFAQQALSDPRMIECMGVLMGIDLSAMAREEGSNEMPPSFTNPSSTNEPQPSSSKKAEPEDVKMAEAQEAEDEDPEAAKEKKLKEEAEAQKKIGNDAYKKRDFATATSAFEKAWEIWPKDVSFLTNLAAVYFEQGDYDKCIEYCEKAVEEGRPIHADFKLIAKAYGRIGSAWAKKGDLGTAIKFFNKSLTEHRTPDILNKLREAEREKAAADASAYINPELSEKSREEGNALYKAGDFASAVKAYSESIKRDPKDPRGYNNRALCYTKLAALPEALRDTEEAIKVDPKFVKAYIRKSSVLFSMREYVKAIEAIQQAADHDEDGKHASEIQQQLFRCNQALSSQRAGESEEETLNRAMRDPEIAQIMNDPVMQQILQQAQQNPGALQDHIKNPIVKDKIMKLVNAGIIKTR